MKAIITITGQIGGNHTLSGAIASSYLHEERTSGMFYSIKYHFNTMKDAKDAIRKAYKHLRNLGYDTTGITGIRRNSANTELSYDASKAIVSRAN